MSTPRPTPVRTRRHLVAYGGALALACGALAIAQGTSAQQAAPSPSQPAQPTSGPGGSDYAFGGVRVSQGGSGSNAYYIFEPVSPKPRSAPLVIINHGYMEFSGYEYHRNLIMHTVRKGNVVIYPRWQVFLTIPCAGSFMAERCVEASLAGIRGGIARLRSEPDRVQPELDKTSYFGFSFGGVITANLTNRWQKLGLPRPRTLFLEDPHNGDNNSDERTFDQDMSGIPSDTLVQCHSGAEGVIREKGKERGSCNAFFPKIGHIPVSRKSLVMTRPDAHGTPALSSKHGVSLSSPTDAYDWYFVWRTFDAMRDCALRNEHCDVAVGDTPAHRFTGTWSDGVPVRPLTIQSAAPLVP